MNGPPGAAAPAPCGAPPGGSLPRAADAPRVYRQTRRAISTRRARRALTFPAGRARRGAAAGAVGRPLAHPLKEISPMYRWALGLLATAFSSPWPVLVRRAALGGSTAERERAVRRGQRRGGRDGQRRGGRPDPLARQRSADVDEDWPERLQRLVAAALGGEGCGHFRQVRLRRGVRHAAEQLTGCQGDGLRRDPDRRLGRGRRGRRGVGRRRPGAAQRLPEPHELLGLRASRGEQRGRPPRQEGGHHAHRLRRRTLASWRCCAPTTCNPTATWPCSRSAAPRRCTARWAQAPHRRRHPLHPVQLPGPGPGLTADLGRIGPEVSYLQNGVATTRGYLQQHPDLVRRFMMAHVEGIARVYQDKPGAEDMGAPEIPAQRRPRADEPHL